jgi:hypothetical protein
LPSHIFRWHFIGTKDAVVPPVISRQVIAQDPLAQLHTYPFGHHDGWQKRWPFILRELAEEENSH